MYAQLETLLVTGLKPCWERAICKDRLNSGRGNTTLTSWGERPARPLPVPSVVLLVVPVLSSNSPPLHLPFKPSLPSPSCPSSPGKPSRSCVSKFTTQIPEIYRFCLTLVHSFRRGLHPGPRGSCHPPLSSEKVRTPGIHPDAIYT